MQTHFSIVLSLYASQTLSVTEWYIDTNLFIFLNGLLVMGECAESLFTRPQTNHIVLSLKALEERCGQSPLILQTFILILCFHITASHLPNLSFISFVDVKSHCVVTYLSQLLR